MRIGAVLPQTEIGGDPGALRAWVSAIEELGYTHVLSYDHVLGADPEVHVGFSGPYNVATTFHEPFVLYGFLAGISKLELVTGIIILPQRQTALVAKQAAEVDLLAEGRFRLGVGIGWNKVEYDALGANFSNRGRRVGEQVELLRALWTTSSVTFDGEFEHVTGAGLAPLPVQRPIPVWFGANQPPALRRAGEIADGWFPQRRPGAGFEEDREIVEEAARRAGRDPGSLGAEGRLTIDLADADGTAAGVEAWRSTGVSHCSINTMGQGCRSIDEHIAALTRLAHDAGIAGPA